MINGREQKQIYGKANFKLTVNKSIVPHALRCRINTLYFALKANVVRSDVRYVVKCSV